MAFDPGKYVNLPTVLKLLGIVMLGLGIFKGWAAGGILTKFLLIAGPIAWYVGDKFYKVYSKT